MLVSILCGLSQMKKTQEFFLGSNEQYYCPITNRSITCYIYSGFEVMDSPYGSRSENQKVQQGL